MTSYTKYFDNTTIISIKAWYDFADNKNQKGHMMIFLWSKIILIESKLKVKLSKKKKKSYWNLPCVLVYKSATAIEY